MILWESLLQYLWGPFLGEILIWNYLLLCFCGDFASEFSEYCKFHVCLEAMVTKHGDKYCTNQGGPSWSVVTFCLVLSFKTRKPACIFTAFRTQCKLIFKVFLNSSILDYPIHPELAEYFLWTCKPQEKAMGDVGQKR